MKIELNEEEIRSAVLGYLQTSGVSVPADTLVDFKNSRGEFGISALVDMNAVQPGNTPAVAEEENEQVEINEDNSPKLVSASSTEDEDDEALFGNA